jgi:hypothetical protein
MLDTNTHLKPRTAFRVERRCPADRNTTRDAALSPSPHAGSNWNLQRMGRGCPDRHVRQVSLRIGLGQLAKRLQCLLANLDGLPGRERDLSLRFPLWTE